MAKYSRNRRKGKQNTKSGKMSSKRLSTRRWFENVGNPNEKGKDPRDNPNDRRLA